MAGKTLFTIMLVHNTTKERRMMPVESVTSTYLSIRWGQAGVYDLTLKTNVLKARSESVRRRQRGPCPWSAEDIQGVRYLVKSELAGVDTKEETRKAMERHEATKPRFDNVTALPIGPTCCEHGVNDGPNFSCSQCLPYDAVHASDRRDPPNERTASTCICPFGILRGDCPEHGYLVPE